MIPLSFTIPSVNAYAEANLLRRKWGYPTRNFLTYGWELRDQAYPPVDYLDKRRLRWLCRGSDTIC